MSKREPAKSGEDGRLDESPYWRLLQQLDEGYLLADVIFDSQGKAIDIEYVDANAAAVRMIGVDPTGRRLRDIACYEEFWYEIWGRVARTGVPERLERHASPEDIWYDFFVFKPEPEDVQSRRVAVIFRDGTKRKRAELALRDSEALQTFLLNLSDALRPLDAPDSVMSTATRLLCSWLDASRCAYYEIEGDEYVVRSDNCAEGVPSVVGRYPLKMFGTSLIEKHLGGHSPIVVDDVSVTHDGPELGAFASIQVGAYVGITLFKQGRFVAGLTVHSRTPRTWTASEVRMAQETAERTWSEVERARAEALVRESDRRKDQFLAVLAHELRNGLAPLVYNVHIGNKGSGETAQLKDLFARSERHLKHLVHLVDDLLDVARISTGKIELKLEVLKVRDVLNLALEACRSDIDRKHHRLTVIDESGSGLVVRGDQMRLTQVVSNLLSNASKYMDGGGRITVRTASEDGDAVIEVSDTGIGIPSASLPQVFDLFTQVRTQQAYAEGGLGIGLSLVRQLVEMHGGRVTAASEGAGHGSTFVVRLPLAVAHRADVPHAIAQADAPSLSRALYVLVVDDQRDAADALAELLRLEGHDAQAAYGGAQALESAHHRRPDLVLLDLGMPGMDGFDVARRLRSDFASEPQMHIVALSGWAQEADRQRTKAASFDGHLAKPPATAELEAVLSAARRR